MGSANASVLPDPVFAIAMRSLPERQSGHARAHRVPREHDAVARVPRVGERARERGEHARAQPRPRVEEAAVDARARVGGGAGRARRREGLLPKVCAREATVRAV